MGPTEPLLADAFTIVEAIRARGHLALIAGGAVRDLVLGRPVTDADIATDMPLDELGRLFTTHVVGRAREFETVVVVRGGRGFEVTRFRGGSAVTAGSGANGRPVRADSPADGDPLRADTARRDFTINSLLMDTECRIVDLQGGMADLRAGVVRAVGDPAERFGEDPARLVRAVRFAACLDFSIEGQTVAAIRAHAPRLAEVAPERIGSELLKMASAPGRTLARAMELLGQFGLLRTVLPEVADLQGLEHRPEKHPEGGVWEHTLAALHASPTTEAAVNLAVLLHDIGKRPALSLEGGMPRYHGHESFGAELAEAIARRVALPQRLREAIVFAVEHHGRCGKFGELRRSKRVALLAHEHWPTLRAVTLADRAARGDMAEVARLEALFVEAEREATTAGERPGAHVLSGTRIMELTGLGPGPRVGAIQRQITEWALDNRVEDAALVEAEVRRIAHEARLSPLSEP